MDEYFLLRILDKVQRIPHDLADLAHGIKVELSLQHEENKEEDNEPVEYYNEEDDE